LAVSLRGGDVIRAQGSLGPRGFVHPCAEEEQKQEEE